MLTTVSGVVGPALVADLVRKETMGKGQSIFSATTWLGGVVGFAAAGLAMQGLGHFLTFLVAILLPLASILLMIFVPVPKLHRDQTGLPQTV